eukprot:5156897-Pyramimonas_sp.AAC.1
MANPTSELHALTLPWQDTPRIQHIFTIISCPRLRAKAPPTWQPQDTANFMPRLGGFDGQAASQVARTKSRRPSTSPQQAP